jgi:hypothetical protein
MSGLVVVAVDPATGSHGGLRWAAGEARLRAAHLHAVMAWRPPRPPAAPAARPPVVPSLSAEDPQSDADARLAAILDEALGPGHHATFAAVRGAAFPVLLAAASDADLLVLDPPHLSDLTRARATLLAPQLVFRVRCPVVVIPPSVA